MSRTNLFRIFGRVLRSESGCWLYQGGIGSGGYGVVSVKDKAVQAHRIAFELANGPRKRKGRNANRCGENNTMARLTAEQVQEIRSLYATGRFSQRAIAVMFNACQQWISDIVRGIAWPHILAESA